jgi:colanic acid biosynthesis glycosyl transferase WcaI
MMEVAGGGVLVEPDDPRALASAIRGLLARPDEARALAARGRRAALEYFSIERMADDMLKVFDQVLAQKPRNI